MKTRFKPKFNIRKGDSVVVIAGDDKDLNKPRMVKEVLIEKAKVLVEGVNIVTKHSKAICPEYQRWYRKKRSSHPYQQCDAVGCES